jgi:hypothetical protein
MNDNGRELVMAMMEEAARRHIEEKARGRALIEQMHREYLEKNGYQRLPPSEPETLSYTELPESQPDSPIRREWDLYRREVGRLLAEGHEGHWLLIKGEEIIGIWDTQEEAKAVALARYLMQPCLIQQIRSREPLVRVSSRIRRCQG